MPEVSVGFPRAWAEFTDPADLDRPEPDERERLMADSRFLHSDGEKL